MMLRKGAEKPATYLHGVLASASAARREAIQKKQRVSFIAHKRWIATRLPPLAMTLDQDFCERAFIVRERAFIVRPVFFYCANGQQPSRAALTHRPHSLSVSRHCATSHMPAAASLHDLTHAPRRVLASASTARREAIQKKLRVSFRARKRWIAARLSPLAMTLENYVCERSSLVRERDFFYCATGIFFIARTGNSPYARPSRASPHAFLLRERATALTREPSRFFIARTGNSPYAPPSRAIVTRGFYQALQGRDR